MMIFPHCKAKVATIIDCLAVTMRKLNYIYYLMSQYRTIDVELMLMTSFFPSVSLLFNQPGPAGLLQRAHVDAGLSADT